MYRLMLYATSNRISTLIEFAILLDKNSSPQSTLEMNIANHNLWTIIQLAALASDFLTNYGGFQFEFVSISWVINPMT